ncbi:acyl-CoA/acyl-ACP dehydrogenase [Agromyces aureus]|uniref:Acyl-CoA dehydrogenase n=1 Tax=Agromyces aureus TaxID=453304 RepID=A0A191WGL4_9MICO|nr:acyl-CoA/acyl-ACP dehydrogenase [Agromyces aureus]ANJ27324.1 acyl-CoA dehydrogenase [Agromyces aureus]
MQLALSSDDRGTDELVDRVVASASSVPDFGLDVVATLSWAARVGGEMPLPGRGETARLWGILAGVAAIDVAGARILEPHLDAIAILEQASADGVVDADAVAGLDLSAESSWGVYAAEGPGVRLEATEHDGAWTVEGTKPWCSLAAHVSHALVTGWIGEGERGLFAVRMRDSDVHPHDGPWVSRGLRQVVSASVDFDRVRAVPVGGPGWYLRRPGFAWGGMGVAAAWWGAAHPLRDALTRAAQGAGADQLASVHLGSADLALWAARAVLAEAAAELDTPGSGLDPKLLAARVRACAADAVERVLTTADHALGPGPLTSDETYARRVADLRIYIAQHHAERDLARLGRMAADR